MNRNEYLNIVQDNLSAFSSDERESALAYYNEFFDDAGEENEQAVIASLGDPKKLADTILKESGINSDANSDSGNNSSAVFTPPQTNKKCEKPSDPTRTILIILLVIFTFPFWIGIVGAAFGVLVAILAVCFAITVASCVTAVVCLAVGFAQLFVNPPVGILLIGIGLIALGISILIIFPVIKAVFKGLSSAFRGVGRFFKNLFNRQEAAA